MPMTSICFNKCTSGVRDASSGGGCGCVSTVEIQKPSAQCCCEPNTSKKTKQNKVCGLRRWLNRWTACCKVWWSKFVSKERAESACYSLAISTGNFPLFHKVLLDGASSEMAPKAQSVCEGLGSNFFKLWGPNHSYYSQWTLLLCANHHGLYGNEHGCVLTQLFTQTTCGLRATVTELWFRDSILQLRTTESQEVWIISKHLSAHGHFDKQSKLE